MIPTPVSQQGFVRTARRHRAAGSILRGERRQRREHGDALLPGVTWKVDGISLWT